MLLSTKCQLFSLFTLIKISLGKMLSELTEKKETFFQRPKNRIFLKG